jgi:hypothetical protein
MAGLLVVEPSDDEVFASSMALNTLYDSVLPANPFSYDLALQQFFFGLSTHPDNATRFAAMYPDNRLVINPTGPLSRTNFYAVNGMVTPTLDVVNGSVALLRLGHLATSMSLTLYVNSSWCELRLVARDGIFQYPDDETGEFPVIRRVVLVTGTRADVAVRCTLPTGTKVPFEVNVFAADKGEDPSLNGRLFTQASVFKINVLPAAPKFKRLPFPPACIKFASYLDSLLEEAVDDEFSVNLATVITSLSPLEFFHTYNGIQFQGFDAPLDTRCAVCARAARAVCVGRECVCVCVCAVLCCDVL